MSHPAKNCFPISTLPYLNTIWRTNGWYFIFTIFFFILGQQAGNTEENTYYMVMEEGQLNQLNSSQTYYIDESHLSNGGNVGGYSKMVLAENPEMQPLSAAQPEVAPNVDSTEATL